MAKPITVTDAKTVLFYCKLPGAKLTVSVNGGGEIETNQAKIKGLLSEFPAVLAEVQTAPGKETVRILSAMKIDEHEPAPEDGDTEAPAEAPAESA